jgi:hypothetical protein
MGMGFSFKVAPGVRVRASSRGIRTSVGPRAARVHFGTGRTAFSSGAGPVTFYTRAGGGTRRSSGVASYQRQQAAYARQEAKEQKLQQARDLLAAFEDIMNLHRAEFPPARPAVAPPAPPVDAVAIRNAHEQAAVAGIGVFKRAERKAAKDSARVAADSEVEALQRANDAAREADQRVLDLAWANLLANDPDHVLDALEAAFEDNEAAAVPVAVSDDEVALVVLAPPADAIPERMPTVTDAGNLSLKKLAKADRSSYYKLLVCGHLLATVREALAVAPGIVTVRTVVIRLSEADAYGARRTEPLLAACFTRDALEGVRWDEADAARVVNDTSTDLRISQKGAAKELVPLDVSGEPDLAAVLQAVDVDELAGV